MIIQRLANSAASTIQITTTATLLTALLDTAAGVANNLPNGLDAVDLTIEGGDIRMLQDGNVPTATVGELLKGNGSIHRLRGVTLHQLYLISTTGSNVQASVSVGVAQPGDEESSDAINSTSTTSTTTSVGTGTTGAKSSIGTTAVQLTASSVTAAKGVLVKAANANSGTVYVGDASSITAGTTDATDGFELGPGEGITLEVNNANLLYVIGSATGQKVFWAAV